jgi:tryptophanyl-tRNA synthetase
VIEVLRPVQERYRTLAGDPTGTAALLARGAEKAEAVAAKTMARASDAIGLLRR